MYIMRDVSTNVMTTGVDKKDLLGLIKECLLAMDHEDEE